MYRLMEGAPDEALVEFSRVYLSGELPELIDIVRSESDELHELEATNLAYHYPGTENGIEDINLRLPRGQFTVITGRVGSGKTTLLRVLLGLLPRDGGVVRWNGEGVDNLGDFFFSYLFPEQSFADLVLGQHVLFRLQASLQIREFTVF